MIDDELKRLFEAMRQENAAAHAGTRGHFDVALEATLHEIRLVAESVAQVSEKLDRTAAALDEKIERTAAETQAMIKFSHVNSTGACARSDRPSARSKRVSPTCRRSGL